MMVVGGEGYDDGGEVMQHSLGVDGGWGGVKSICDQLFG